RRSRATLLSYQIQLSESITFFKIFFVSRCPAATNINISPHSTTCNMFLSFLYTKNKEKIFPLFSP
ncbi:MAG: hypothetical protein ACQEW2_16355, partial [Bacillota bacterium]